MLSEKESTTDKNCREKILYRYFISAALLLRPRVAKSKVYGK